MISDQSSPIIPWGYLQADNNAVARQLLEEWYEFSVDYWRTKYPMSRIIDAFADKYVSWVAGGPRGSTAHYTGGPDGVLSAIWLAFNKSNRGSSCHGTFMQRNRDNLLTQLHSGKYPLLAMWMLKPALQHGKLDHGKWGATWTNDHCYQFEIESLGRLTSDGSGGFYRPSRGNKYLPPENLRDYTLTIGAAHWQAWSLRTLVTWVNIHRAIASVHVADGAFKPERVLPHSAVQLAKSDAGLAFPMQALRLLICEPILDDEQTAALYEVSLRGAPGVVDDTAEVQNDDPADVGVAEALDWLEDMQEPHEERHVSLNPHYYDEVLPRHDYDKPDSWDDEAVVSAASGTLMRLGYYQSAEYSSSYMRPASAPPADEYYFQKAVHAFQRASRSKGWGRLTIDGDAGPKTLKTLHKKAKQMGLRTDSCPELATFEDVLKTIGLL
jgi:hypothetical protein